MVDDNWLERLVATKLAEHDARMRLRKDEEAARNNRHKGIALKREREAEERAMRRELRKRPCGAKTRTGQPCRRKGLSRGGRCANHGGQSTGPKTEAGKARIAAVQRARWERLRVLKSDLQIARLRKMLENLNSTTHAVMALASFSKLMRRPWNCSSVGVGLKQKLMELSVPLTASGMARAILTW